jgi:hypothetical protein
MSAKRRTHKNDKTHRHTKQRHGDGQLDGQDKRVQRVLSHLGGTFDMATVMKLIVKKFKVPTDELLVSVAWRIIEIHYECGSYTDVTMAKILQHVLTRQPLPLEEQPLYSLPRYHCVKGVYFYFVLQPYQKSLSVLVFVDVRGRRVPPPRGVTMRGGGETQVSYHNGFLFVWMERYELLWHGESIVTLEPQCSRVVY